MTRLVLYLLTLLVAATGLSWLADRPGSMTVNWEGYEVQTSVFRAVVIFAVLLVLAAVALSILRQLWNSPATVGHFLMRRRQRRGLDALSSGMIAVGAGDRSNATRYAIQARKSLPNEPLTHLLRAQAAQLSGDKTTARRIFEAMLGSPDTEQLGLRGLFLEASRESESEAARQFAERAVGLNPKLSWPVEALFDLQCKASDWAGALETLTIARKNGHMDKPSADRKRAVLLTAQAQALEENNAEKSLALALEAHGLAPTLIPAAAIAGRLLASKGSTPKAAKVLQKTWAKAPHPDLATAYAYARIGDSPRDRLDRVKQLCALNTQSIEGPVAVAIAAIEAKQFDEARSALWPLLESRLTQRVATLMARIEGEEHGDKGKVREWLARAVNAPRDPAWTADGVVSERWSAISPVTGSLDAFQWRVPVDDMQAIDGDELTTRLESLVTLGAPAADAAADIEIEATVVSSQPKRATADRTDEVEEAAPAVAAANLSARRDSSKSAPAVPRALATEPEPDDDPQADMTLPTKEPEPVAKAVPRPQAAIQEPRDSVTTRTAPKPTGKTVGRTKRGERVEAPVEEPLFSRLPDDPGPDSDDPAPQGTVLRSRRAN